MPKPDVITYSDPYEPGTTEYVPASRLAKKDAQIARLRAALAPFVAFLDKAEEGFTSGWAERSPPSKKMAGLNDARLTLGDFLAARAALTD